MLVPAKSWLDVQKAKTQIYAGAVPYCGSLSLSERAQIANWFETHVTKDPAVRVCWLGLLPIAHAHTIYIADTVRTEDRRLKDLLRLKPKDKLTKEDVKKLQVLTEEEILNRAWSLQVSGISSILSDIDVDCECLSFLEQEMFERTNRAGIAGNVQWGLDVGDNEDENVYKGIPLSWHSVSGEREGDDNEFLPGPNFNVIQRVSAPVVVRGPRPKPIPKKKATKGK